MSTNDPSKSDKPLDQEQQDSAKAEPAHKPKDLEVEESEGAESHGEPAEEILKPSDRAFEEAAADGVNGLPKTEDLGAAKGDGLESAKPDEKTDAAPVTAEETAPEKAKKSSFASIASASVFVIVAGGLVLGWDHWKAKFTNNSDQGIAATDDRGPVTIPTPDSLKNDQNAEADNAEPAPDEQNAGEQVTPDQGTDQTTPNPPQATAPSTPAAPQPGQTSDQALAQRVTDLTRALDRANARIAQLESAKGFDAAPLENSIKALTDKIAALEARPQWPEQLPKDVEALRNDLAETKRTSADAAAVLRLADRVERSETTIRELEARRSTAATLLLSANQLRDAVQRALPYDAEWRALAVMAAGSDAEIQTQLEALKARKDTGIPSFATLQKRFADLQAPVLRADLLPTEQNWWRDTLDRLGSLVMIRREDGTAAGDDTAAIIARMDQALAAQDLAVALRESKLLSPAASQTLAPWLADAQSRLAADKALSALAAHALALAGAKQ